ncbi:MAG: DUF402 domain-containing protein [Anaerolineae bacterium]|nr:DUF402 domain-containing protein [Anaerolineae bacterium]
MFPTGSTAVIRGMINGKLWLAQSVTVVQDSPGETVLLLRPGAQCAYPSGYWRWKMGNPSQGTRWDDVKSMVWTLRRFPWHTKRLLILMEPDKFYATYLMWDDATDRFLGYYINYQTPFRRDLLGFRTLDLELDIVIHPDLSWEIKDAEGYQLGLREGCITPEQDAAIRALSPRMARNIRLRDYPFDGTWVDWCPDPAWPISQLPDGWDEIIHVME